MQSSSATYLGADRHASVFQQHHSGQDDVRSSRSQEVLAIKADACAPTGVTYNGDNTSGIESYNFYNATDPILNKEHEKYMMPGTAAIWRYGGEEKNKAQRDIIIVLLQLARRIKTQPPQPPFIMTITRTSLLVKVVVLLQKWLSAPRGESRCRSLPNSFTCSNILICTNPI